MFFSTENFIEKEQRRLFFRRIFRRVFLEDWFLKLIALIITLALWLGVTGLRAPTTVRLRNVTLNPRVSNEMEITNSPVQEVDIVVTGDKAKIDRLNPHDLVMSVDLTDVKTGDRTVQLNPENVNLELPNGVKLEEIQPNRIALRLEKVEEREVEVKAETEGNVADGFEIYSQTVIPAKVRVRGAESVVRSLDSIMTEKINVENRREDFIARQVGLNVVNPNVTVLDGIVEVAFKIGEKRAERIMIVTVNTEHENKKAMVVLYGAHTILENLRSEDLKIELVKFDTGEMLPQLILPPNIQDKIEVRKIKLSP
ncbi:MAG: CdaR family protein [Pyrinomonadaceae bacterium]